MTQKKLYLCPQKLQAKLLIGWWTVGDLCITLVLLLAFFLTGYAPFFLALCLGYLFLSLRFDGKSNLLGGLKRHMLYHTTHQLFVKTAKEQNKPHKKALPIQRVIDFKLEDNYVISDGHYVYFYRYYAPNTHIMTDDEIQSEIGKLGRLFDTLKCSFSLFATDKVENLEAMKDLLSGSEERSNAVLNNDFAWAWQVMMQKDGYTCICLDEMHLFLRNPYMRKLLQSSVYRARKYNGMIGCCTQRVLQCLNSEYDEEVSAILDMSPTKFLFHPGPVDHDVIKDKLKLTDGESNYISNSHKGHCLVMAGHERYAVHIGKMPHEDALFGSGGGR